MSEFKVKDMFLEDEERSQKKNDVLDMSLNDNLPEEIEAKIKRQFPDEYTIKVEEGFELVKMANGRSYTVNGKTPIEDAEL